MYIDIGEGDSTISDVYVELRTDSMCVCVCLCVRECVYVRVWVYVCEYVYNVRRTACDVHIKIANV